MLSEKLKQKDGSSGGVLVCKHRALNSISSTTKTKLIN
jgi:hypothetical protein